MSMGTLSVGGGWDQRRKGASGGALRGAGGLSKRHMARKPSRFLVT